MRLLPWLTAGAAFPSESICDLVGLDTIKGIGNGHELDPEANLLLCKSVGVIQYTAAKQDGIFIEIRFILGSISQWFNIG